MIPARCPKCKQDLSTVGVSSGLILRHRIEEGQVVVEFGAGKVCSKCGFDLEALDSVMQAKSPGDLVKRIKKAPKKLFTIKKKL